MEQRLITTTETWPALTEAPRRPAPALRRAVDRLRSLDGFEALPYIFASKLATFGLVLIATLFFPIVEELRSENYAYPVRGDLATRFTTWDASHYLYVSEEGYREGQMSNAFAPLYPFAVRAAHLLVPDRVAAALLVSNLASAVAAYFLYVYVKRRYSRDVAIKALVLLLTFPTAFYLNIIYSEGLFLLMSVAFLVGLQRHNLPVAAAAASLMPLTRMVGVAVVVPLAVYLVADALSKAPLTSDWPVRLRLVARPQLLYLLAPLAGLGLYCAYMQLETGDPLAMVHAQLLFPSERGTAGLLNPAQLYDNLFDVPLTLHNDTGSILDRLFFLLFLVSLPLAWRRLDRPVFVFALLMGLTPLAGSFMSYMRYVLLAFPLFIAWASYLQDKNPRIFAYGVLPLLILQEVFVIFQATHNGVA
jgi:hypothetical protein